jgi:cation diffusion facilitator family transporter
MLYSLTSGETVEAHYRIVALIAVMITIILKYWLARYVYKQGKRSNNSILIAGSKENMSDVLSASSVFIAIILSFFKEEITLFRYADKAAGFIISLLIIRTAFHILKDNINTIIGECETDEEVIYRIKGIIMSVPEVLSIDNLVVMKFGSYYQIMLAAGVDSECKFEEAHAIAHNIEHELIESDMKTKYVSVHVNPYKKNISC